MALRGKFDSQCEMDRWLECIEMHNVVLHGINVEELATHVSNERLDYAFLSSI
jgi:hypothetical protein